MPPTDVLLFPALHRMSSPTLCPDYGFEVTTKNCLRSWRVGFLFLCWASPSLSIADCAALASTFRTTPFAPLRLPREIPFFGFKGRVPEWRDNVTPEFDIYSYGPFCKLILRFPF